MLKVGDRVEKIAGQRRPGLVVSARLGRYFYEYEIPKHRLEEYEFAFAKFPDWTRKNVFTVELDEPSRFPDFSTFATQYKMNNPLVSDEIVQNVYNNLPISQYIVALQDEVEQEEKRPIGFQFGGKR